MRGSLPCRASDMQRGGDRPQHSQATDLQTDTTVKRGSEQASDLQGGGVRALYWAMKRVLVVGCLAIHRRGRICSLRVLSARSDAQSVVLK
jgi:hypothetical protein